MACYLATYSAGYQVTRLVTALASGVESRWQMAAIDYLAKAGNVLAEREENYGDFDIMSYRAASLQTLIFEEKTTAEQWALGMVATKVARICVDPHNEDNYIDAMCYLAQAASLALTPDKVE